MSIQDKKTARSLWLKGFDIYGKAKNNSEISNYKLALEQYKKALNLFEKIKAAYPDWNKDLIDYRLSVCSAKIVDVKAALSQSSLKSSTLEIDQENIILKQKIKKLEKELSDTKNQLDITFASLDVAKREASRNDKVVKQVGDLLREKIKLTRKCAILTEQLDDLKGSKVQQSANDAGKEDLKQALIQLETIKKDREEVIQSLEAEKKQFKELLEERNKLLMKVEEYENAGKEKEMQKGNTLEEISELKTRIQKFQLNQKKLEEELVNMRKKQAEKEIKIEQLKADLDKARSDSPSSNDATVEKLSNDKDLLSQSLENANEKILQQSNVIKDLKKQVTNATKRVEVLGNTLAKIDKIRAGVEEDMGILNKKLEKSTKIIADQKKKLQTQQANYENLKKDFEIYAKTAQDTKKDEKAFLKLMVELKNQQRIKAELQSELDAKNNDYAGMDNKLTQLQEELKEAHLKIKESEEHIKELENQPISLETFDEGGIDELKGKNAKMSVELDSLRIANTELITKVNSLNDQVENLQKNINEKQKLLNKAQEICEQKIKGVENKKYSEPTQSAEYMALLNENDQLKALAQEQKETLTNFRQKLEESVKDVTEKNIEIEALTNKLNAKSDVMNSPQYAQLSQECERLKLATQEYNKKISTLHANITALNDGIKNRDEQIKSLNEKLVSNENIDIKTTPEYLTLKGNNDVLNKILNDQKEVIEKMNGEITKLRSDLDEKNKKLLSLKEVDGQANQILAEKAQIEKELKAKTEEIEKVTARAESLKSELDDVNQQLVDSRDSHSSLTEVENTLKTKNEQLQISLDSKEQEIENIKDTLNELKTELTNKEMELNQLKSSHINDTDVENSTKYIAMLNENDQLQTILEDKDNELKSMKASVSDLEKENTDLLSLKQSLEEEKASIEAQKIEKEKASKEILKLLDAAIEAENSGKSDAAVWYYETVLEQAPDNVVALAKLGIMKAEKGDFKDAEPLLTKATVQDAQNLDALLALTFCNINQRKYYKALSNVALANAVNPNNSTVHRYMGIICSYLGWYDVAETEFRKAFRINPKSAETAYNAAVNLVKADISKINIAKQWYDRAVELGIERDSVLEDLFEKKFKEIKAKKKKSAHKKSSHKKRKRKSKKKK
jgi:chromosome segregation ATPase